MAFGISELSRIISSSGRDDTKNLTIGSGVKNCPSLCLTPSSRKPSNKSPRRIDFALLSST